MRQALQVAKVGGRTLLPCLCQARGKSRVLPETLDEAQVGAQMAQPGSEVGVAGGKQQRAELVGAGNKQRNT